MNCDGTEEMIYQELLIDFTRACLYMLLLHLFWGLPKKMILHYKNLLAMIVITGIQLLSFELNVSVGRSLLPVEIMLVMLLYGWSIGKKMNEKYFFVGSMEAYATSVLLRFIFGMISGSIGLLLSISVETNSKRAIISVMQVGILIFIQWQYDWLKIRFTQKVKGIIYISGAFVLFFQQFMQLALGRNDYNFATILALLLYFTMIFTAFMLLQHNHLTAKQQAIEEDNRQMSQRLHRSKDVLGVVSQVVASEDHIDPKLRKELADFCDDEMNEMQDRALGVNLIGDTGIELVNVMLQKQMMRCADLNISFDVMIPGPIDRNIREIGISVTEFMRMLNDLLKNAVKAILSSENPHRELLLIMGDAGNDCLEIRLYDSGVPFPAKILENLGERGNTTDGTGNGLADTVETLRHYGASFAIEPIEPGTDIYTKCIHIAFDGLGCLPRSH